MTKVIGKEDLDRILKIEAENFSGFVRKIFELYPDGIDIRYNDKNMVCKRCDSIKVAKLVYGDEFMRLCSKDKMKCEYEIIRLKHLCLSINVSPTRFEGSKDYFCLNCGYE